MSAPHTPWTFEVHDLSEGFSAIVYDARGLAIADHADEATARLIAAAPDQHVALQNLLDLVMKHGMEPLPGFDPDEFECDVQDAVSAASSALALARGESPHNQSNPKVGA